MDDNTQPTQPPTDRQPPSQPPTDRRIDKDGGLPIHRK